LILLTIIVVASLDYANSTRLGSMDQGVFSLQDGATGISGNVTMRHVLLSNPSIGKNLYWTQINIGTIANNFVCEGGVRMYQNGNSYSSQVFMTVFDNGVSNTIHAENHSGNCTIMLERSATDPKTWSMYVDGIYFYSYTYSTVWTGSACSELETRVPFATGQINAQICSWNNLQFETGSGWITPDFSEQGGFGNINADLLLTSPSSYIVTIVS